MKKSIFFSVFFLLLSTLVFSQDTIKLMTYNLLNYDNTDSIRDSEFRVIVSSVNPDILVVQEIKSQGAVDQFLSNVMNKFGQTYKAGIFKDGYDTDNAIFYKPSKFDFISNIPIKTTHRDINEFTLIHLLPKVTLHIFSVHLKSSTGSTNEAQRASEVDSLRKRTNSFPAGRNFIVCGDFNLYNSFEPAYQKLLKDNLNDDGNVFDPISMSGNWNNPSYSKYHTQSPRIRSFDGGVTGGLDDRFDLILHSTNIQNSNTIKLIPGSYIPYGNDGNHYNDSINSQPNTAVPQKVANALHNASDHLPVFVSFAFTSPELNVHQLDYSEEIQIFPNPFSSFIDVYTGDTYKNSSLSIFDALGRLVLNTTNLNPKFRVQVNNLSTGMYFYEISNNQKEIFRGKLIKNREL